MDNKPFAEMVLEALLLRPGIASVSPELIKDMINDSVTELKAYLNYEDESVLPDGCIPAVKELTLIRFNRDGTEGIQSEGYSGNSTTYISELPLSVKRTIYRYRKLRRS